MSPLDNLSPDDESGGDASPKVEVDTTGHAGECTQVSSASAASFTSLPNAAGNARNALSITGGDREVLQPGTLGARSTRSARVNPIVDTPMARTSPPLARSSPEHLVRESDRRFEHAFGAALGLGRQRAPTAQLPVGVTDRRSDLRAPISSATTTLAAPLVISATVEHDRAGEEARVIGVDARLVASCWTARWTRTRPASGSLPQRTTRAPVIAISSSMLGSASSRIHTSDRSLATEIGPWRYSIVDRTRSRRRAPRAT